MICCERTLQVKNRFRYWHFHRLKTHPLKDGIRNWHRATEGSHVETNLSGLAHTNYKHSLGQDVGSALVIRTMKLFQISHSRFCSLVSLLLRRSYLKMIISYVTNSPIIHLSTIADIAAETCESLKLMVDQVTVATIWHPGTKVTNLSIVVLDEEISLSTPTGHESLLLLQVKTGIGPAPR